MPALAGKSRVVIRFAFPRACCNAAGFSSRNGLLLAFLRGLRRESKLNIST
jgi:hypothetical protein